MPNWAAVQRSNHVTVVAFNGRKPPIYFTFKADMCAKVRSQLSKYDYPPDLKERSVELALHQAELFAGTGAT